MHQPNISSNFFNDRILLLPLYLWSFVLRITVSPGWSSILKWTSHTAGLSVGPPLQPVPFHLQMITQLLANDEMIAKFVKYATTCLQNSGDSQPPLSDRNKSIGYVV